jgi:hypothetical protein
LKTLPLPCGTNPESVRLTKGKVFDILRDGYGDCGGTGRVGVDLGGGRGGRTVTGRCAPRKRRRWRGRRRVVVDLRGGGGGGTGGQRRVTVVLTCSAAPAVEGWRQVAVVLGGVGGGGTATGRRGARGATRTRDECDVELMGLTEQKLGERLRRI